MNKVVHVKKERYDIYMGRGMEWSVYWPESPWHNPFRIKGFGTEYSRDGVIIKFAEYFYAPEQKWLRDKALAEISSDAVLGCWCAPARCHSDIVAGYLEWKRGGKDDCSNAI
jgi:hypothetical protein